MDEHFTKLIYAMTEYDCGDAMRIQHFMKVFDYASLIGRMEKINDETQYIVESAAVVHDIGIHISEKKYGSSAGPYQEKEGPSEAEKLLNTVGGYTKEQIKRICYLVGHHHTYKNIDGIDYQILVEADFLVNLFEKNAGRDEINNVLEKIFKTNTGKSLMKLTFGI